MKVLHEVILVAFLLWFSLSVCKAETDAVDEGKEDIPKVILPEKDILDEDSKNVITTGELTTESTDSEKSLGCSYGSCGYGKPKCCHGKYCVHGYCKASCSYKYCGYKKPPCCKGKSCISGYCRSSCSYGSCGYGKPKCCSGKYCISGYCRSCSYGACGYGKAPCCKGTKCYGGYCKKYQPCSKYSCGHGRKCCHGYYCYGSYCKRKRY